MKSSLHHIFVLLLLLTVSVEAAPTFGDLAVTIAKRYFMGYVGKDASLEECASFLNSKGVCFSIFDLMDTNVSVTREDFARAVGQSKLLFLGEAEAVKGCINKPAEIETWVDYCLLNDVGLDNLWRSFLLSVEEESFLEVQYFFGSRSEEGEGE